MTIDEMKERFPGKWVVLDELERDPGATLGIRSARLICVSDTRDGAWDAADEVDLRHGAVFFLGPYPPGSIFIL